MLRYIIVLIFYFFFSFFFAAIGLLGYIKGVILATSIITHRFALGHKT